MTGVQTCALPISTSDGGSMLGKGSSGKGMNMGMAHGVEGLGSTTSVGRSKSATIESFKQGYDTPFGEKQRHTNNKTTENTRPMDQSANKIKRNF